jgi:nitrite reductase/ring-hydroxylating ferredoxin subunit
MREMHRRRFLANAAMATARVCGACPFAALGTAMREAAKEPVDAGTLADYPRDGVYSGHAESEGFFLVRAKGKLYALDSACTHKKTLLKFKDNALACPKHGARFNLEGVVTKAPAKRPLPRFAISADGTGKLTVDPSRTFDKDNWDDTASFVAMK